MIDALVFPDTRAGIFDLIDGTTHLGESVRAVYQLPADDYGSLQGPFPVALIYVTGGTRGFVDRVDRATIEVYAEGEAAVNTLESISASITGSDIETPSRIHRQHRGRHHAGRHPLPVGHAQQSHGDFPGHVPAPLNPVRGIT